MVCLRFALKRGEKSARKEKETRALFFHQINLVRDHERDWEEKNQRRGDQGGKDSALDGPTDSPKVARNFWLGFSLLYLLLKRFWQPLPGKKAWSNKKRRKSSDQRWRFVRKTGFARNGASFTSFARPAKGISAMLSERIAIFSAGKRVLLNLIDWCPRKRCN